ncbi:MAG: YHS domain-containing protein, partial [Planctomycetota bacterium]
MKSRLALLFPWFVFLFIIVVIGIDQTRNRGSENLSPQSAEILDTASVARDPVCYMDISVEDSYSVVYQGKFYYFCATVCRESFKKDAEKYINATVAPKTHTMHGIPSWMYQWSVAIILLISFGLFEFLNWFQEKRGTNATPTTPKSMDSRWVISRWKPLHRLLKWSPFTFLLRSITVFCFLMII